MSTYLGIGVNSGTSMDGLDVCYVEFTGDVDTDVWGYRILNAKTFPYAGAWPKRLEQAHMLSGRDLVKLNVEYAHYVGKIVSDLIERECWTVDFIGIHGHTIFHQPEKGFTFQIGDGETLATYFHCPLVTNFRNKDVALGGQGSPLAPMGDKSLYSHVDYCVNLGGLANITVGEVGFDICPCNMLLNFLAKRHDSTNDFDPDGSIARRGNVRGDLLDQLNSLQYYKKEPPKTLSREWFDENILSILEQCLKDHSVPDILCTCVEHIAQQITKVCVHYPHTPDTAIPFLQSASTPIKEKQVLFTGGGSHNTFLLESISRKLDCHGIEMVEADEDTVMFKEALIFAFIGLRSMLGLVNVLSTVTGAKMDTVSGSIHLPPDFEPLGPSARTNNFRFQLTRKRTSTSSISGSL